MAVLLSRRCLVGYEKFFTLRHVVAQVCCPTVVCDKLVHNIQTVARTSGKEFGVCCPDIKGWNSRKRWQSSVPVDHNITSLKDFIDPYQLLQDDLVGLFEDIQQELKANTNQPSLQAISTYYFDGEGKAIRPMMVMLMSRAINFHICPEDCRLLASQRQLAMIAEMIHSASLIHDDLIDQSHYRRGKPSINMVWNPRQIAMAGDFVIAVASMMISRLKNDDVTILFSEIITNLVRGEFMQLGSKLTINDRFAHYLTKTYHKTASLIANVAKSTALLAGANDELTNIAFQYGRNIGIAFQLVDDLLDFVSSSDTAGKPTAVDLKLGLATAPVLFACKKYPELDLMILRRFEGDGDIEKAFELVHKSQGLEETKILAQKYCTEAVKYAKLLGDSPYQQSLQVVCDLVLNRIN